MEKDNLCYVTIPQGINAPTFRLVQEKNAIHTNL